MNPNQPDDQGLDTGLPSVGPFQGRSLLWPGLAVVAVVSLVALVWLANASTDANWAVVFEGRTFDNHMRRQALTLLTQQGLAHKPGTNGEILVPPEALNTAQAALDKAGLKPATLDELRTVSEGPLAILESPAQREHRRLAAKERELAWLLRQHENVAQAHVTIEPNAAATRWIGSGDRPRQRVRVFIETARPAERLSEQTVSLIEKQVLTTLPTTAPGLVSIHDARRIYLMAGGNQNATESARPAENKADEETLADRIRSTVSGLENAIVRVSLHQVDETPTLQAKPVPEPADTAPRLVLNEPISIEMQPAAPANPPKPTKTQRANIQILMKSETAPDLRHKTREAITAMIAPVLLEQLDWQSQPAMPVAELAAKPATRQAAIATQKKPEPEIQSLTANGNISLTPWIAGGVVLALIVGGTVLLKSTRNASATTEMNWPGESPAQQWVRDLAAAVTPPEPHMNQPQQPLADDTAAAAQLLSGWITDDSTNT